MPAQHYSTNQRTTLLAYLEENAGKHITAADAFLAMRKRGYPIGKATVYHCFDKQTREGQLLKYQMVEGACACYEYITATPGCSGHYHLKCNACGTMLHLECEDVARLYALIREVHELKINNLQTVFHGTCGACMVKKEGTKQ